MPDLQKLHDQINELRASLGLEDRKALLSETKVILDREHQVYSEQLKVMKYWQERIDTEDGKKEALFALQLFSLIPLPLWTAKRGGEIAYWNKYAERAYSYLSETVLGEDFISLFVNEAEKAQARQDLDDIIEGREGVEHFNMADDKDSRGNTVRVLTCCFAVFDPRIRDVTQAEISFEISQLDQHQAELDEMQQKHKQREARKAEFLEKDRDYELRTLQSYHSKFLERCEDKMKLCSDIIGNPNTAAGAKTLQDDQLKSYTQDKYNFTEWYLQTKQKLEDCVTSEEMYEIRALIDQRKEQNV